MPPLAISTGAWFGFGVLYLVLLVTLIILVPVLSYGALIARQALGFFEWLRPMTSLIVDVDSLSRTDFDRADVDAIVGRVQSLFGSSADPAPIPAPIPAPMPAPTSAPPPSLFAGN